MTEETLIRACKKQDRKAQQWLYERYGPMLFGIVRRYVNSAEQAEDVFVQAMCKIFMKIDSFREEGSFEGWMKRIMVNESLMHLRKQKNLSMVRELGELQIADKQDFEASIHAEEILALLDQLPTGYRAVFNMYVVEGYKHREIAEELGISINTSKSQLILAKKRMRELLKKRQIKAG